MKVFISWSGERSRRIADLLNIWISGVIQRLEIFQSTEMQRGAMWFSEISNALTDVSDGIVCLTKENLNSPWILFEAGAIAKGNSQNRVYTFLIDLDPSDISDPLAQFNHTLPNREAIYNLIRTLNSRLGRDSLVDKTLNTVFEIHWPFFADGFKRILNETQAGQLPQKNESEILTEMHDSIKRIEKLLFNEKDIIITSTPQNHQYMDYSITNLIYKNRWQKLKQNYFEDIFKSVIILFMPQNSSSSLLLEDNNKTTIESDEDDDTDLNVEKAPI